MGFFRKGSPVAIEHVNMFYDKAKETAVECPYCHKALDIKASNGLYKKANMVVIGKISMKCPHCKETIQI